MASPTSFAAVTDSTLHRDGWRSPRAPDKDQYAAHPRKIPNRFQALLRYDVLLSPALTPAASTRRPSPPPSRSHVVGCGPRQPPSNRGATAPALVLASTSSRDTDDHSPDPASTKKTNLDELKWFQHRWLDKHGKNSHLKEYREKMVLLRRWFESLDADGSGEVGLDELEDPLVSVGLARSREEVQRLIDQAGKDGSGEVTFHEFLRMMNPEKPKRARQRQPLHKPKPKPPTDTGDHSASSRSPLQAAHQAVTDSDATAASPRQLARRSSTTAAGSTATNPVVKLFEDLQSGKLGDLAIPFPVLITAYRRRMLLNAHMADDPTARRLGTSVLQALESTRREATSLHRDKSMSYRRGSVSSTAAGASSSSSYSKSYITTAQTVAQETSSTKECHLPVLKS